MDLLRVEHGRGVRIEHGRLVDALAPADDAQHEQEEQADGDTPEDQVRRRFPSVTISLKRHHLDESGDRSRFSVSSAVTARSRSSLHCAAPRKEAQRSGGKMCVTSAPKSPASRSASSDR